MSKTGGMGVTIYQREDGAKTTAVCVSCYEVDGELVSSVTVGGEFVAEFRTKR